ncbi:hypothetical protein GCM10010873_17820 [Cypionkella aquatica]|uniref:Pilus assembly protein n=1 Tax=Cypionkella aquatica TaxID=1756042 RepID=A0AA37WZK9_9RHOB|nr:hypothetical protein [Cypionkella aquatica]GLS86808.1 hypothetical protein GCM10010873_17820 [Cypionkella aquatica]
MKRSLKKFLRDTDGAVTVDWVVLSAAVIGVAMTVLWPVAYSAESSASGLGEFIASVKDSYD